ncbi:MAG: MoaA/NifB/PqqE family protein [Myxococcales bacterium]|nr:MoaA/NifB/PqqE family protein [Myxococcales bacterium]
MTERLIHTTTSLCRTCKEAVPASVVALASGEVWMKKICDGHGAQEVRLSTNAAWYEQTRATKQQFAAPAVIKKEIEHGCPFDCGPCTSHTQKVRLPVVTITSACNLDCPICYVHNKNDDAYHMPLEDFALILEHLRTDHGGELDIINLTGGEPTLHPRLFEMLAMAKQAGIHRVTVCSNGIRLAKDEAFVEQLAAYGARIALSFDTFDPHADKLMQGANMLATKIKCMELCEKHGVDVTLIPVMTRGVNEHEVGKILEFALARSNVRHVEVHTMTFTGQSGATFQRSGRISMFEVLEEIEKTTAGLLRPTDFVTSPCAHPLCYQIAYLLLDPDGGPPIPFTRFMPARELHDALSERLYLEPSPRLEESLKQAIDRLWVEDDPESARTLRLLRYMLDTMFPSDHPLTHEQAIRAGERAIKAVYVHSHMDEETFDVERAVDCCDSNCYADGSTIPVCNYNVLYREKEAKFNVAPAQWGVKSGGHKVFSLPVLR